MRTLLGVILAFALISSSAAQDQAKKQEPAKGSTPAAKAPESYRLEFKIYELEGGKRTNERAYTMIGGVPGGWTNLRTGTRVPVTTGEKSTYIDVGVRLDCHLSEEGGKVFAQVRMEISSLVLPEPGNEPRSSTMPVLRNTNADIGTEIKTGKPQIIASADDVNSKKKVQVELTATRIE
ncbi:MAG TPA: hypothetical protein VF532_03715 [Candidatus Angelobacter sp.]